MSTRMETKRAALDLVAKGIEDWKETLEDMPDGASLSEEQEAEFQGDMLTYASVLGAVAQN